jgi:MFS family permease
MSMIGSSFMMGTFIGSFFLPRLADIYGRRPIFIAGLIMYIFCVTGLYFSTQK